MVQQCCEGRRLLHPGIAARSATGGASHCCIGLRNIVRFVHVFVWHSSCTRRNRLGLKPCHRTRASAGLGTGSCGSSRGGSCGVGSCQLLRCLLPPTHWHHQPGVSSCGSSCCCRCRRLLLLFGLRGLRCFGGALLLGLGLAPRPFSSRASLLGR